jgi:hypothetical protein
MLLLQTVTEAKSEHFSPASLFYSIVKFFSILEKLNFPVHRIPEPLFFKIVLNLISASHLRSFLALEIIPLREFETSSFIATRGIAETISTPFLHPDIWHPFTLAQLPLLILTPDPNTLEIFSL